MRTTAPLATIALAWALAGCAGSGARALGPEPVVVVGDAVVAPKGKSASNADGAEPHLARQQALEDAEQGGIIGLLGSDETRLGGIFGSSDDIEGEGVALGGPVGIIGGVPGGSLGGVPGGVVGGGFGAGGLGISGGGGRADGVGLGSLGAIGHGSGYGAGSLFGSVGLGGRSSGPRAKVRFDSATVTGPLAAEVVQRVAGEHTQDVEDCYLLEAARDAHPRGRVTLAISIDAAGSVTEVRVPETTLWTRDLPSCIAQAIGAWKFPPPAQGGEVKVILPVNL
ncbi:AgmX/PglI C-terminal domain-containing protein [Polyangium aurulentum]|uniref:AgmX/PglI C-terminal domain-containing protein n=1 Tax=Polyangium aurulentum TaxID=2567896 RepID=UPI0010AE0EDD|nr:AgmX/PglI C-terminal domain-containing protein [Polyangium aurulentum]UQA55299.1 AgmX/PglI C-terminal domain-containing protein [Polyangium aurulentum]